MSDEERAELKLRLDLLVSLRDVGAGGRDSDTWHQTWEIAWRDACACANAIIARYVAGPR